MSQLIETLFPGLSVAEYRVTSPISPEYNCIAWAAGDVGSWWWPDAFGDYHWPLEIVREETLDAFATAYRALGYEPSSSYEIEAGLEKIAIYADASGRPLHAARQLPSGAWTSKLGQLEDIEHSTLNALEGDQYGHVRLILSRPVEPSG